MITQPQPPDAAPPNSATGPASSPETAVIRSETLFGQGREVLILHDDRAYRLGITRQNKLILTK